MESNMQQRHACFDSKPLCRECLQVCSTVSEFRKAGDGVEREKTVVPIPCSDISFGFNEKMTNFEVAVERGLMKWRGTASEYKEMKC